jgi:hypothetical protein
MDRGKPRRHYHGRVAYGHRVAHCGDGARGYILVPEEKLG